MRGEGGIAGRGQSGEGVGNSYGLGKKMGVRG